MTLETLRQEYGTTTERNSLLDSLEDEILYYKENTTILLLVVFGSFINDREKNVPGDIDILVGGLLTPEGVNQLNDKFKLPTKNHEHIDMHGSFGMGEKLNQSVNTAEKIIQKFNSNKKNIEKDISVGEHIVLDI